MSLYICDLTSAGCIFKSVYNRKILNLKVRNKFRKYVFNAKPDTQKKKANKTLWILVIIDIFNKKDQ